MVVGLTNKGLGDDPQQGKGGTTVVFVYTVRKNVYTNTWLALLSKKVVA
jgi:hypothetical protein